MVYHGVIQAPLVVLPEQMYCKIFSTEDVKSGNRQNFLILINTDLLFLFKWITHYYFMPYINAIYIRLFLSIF